MRVLLAWLLWVGGTLAAAEVAARGFWALRFGIPVAHPERVLPAWYPELPSVERASPSRDDGTYDVLLLGGSVLHPRWGNVTQELYEQLAYAGHRDVRIFNLARKAHTSRDSLLKYEALEDERFDLVVVYHGINETRANVIPPLFFREDYSHLPWYRRVNAVAPFHGRAHFALPYTLAFLSNALDVALHPERYHDPDHPRAEWLAYGAEIRSAGTFRRNLEAVLARAEERGDPVVLMSFATHLPGDYSLEAFREGRLDYGLHVSPVELWGDPQHVMAGVEEHNQVVRQLAEAHPDVLFVDQAELLPASGSYYNDVCHLSGAGSARFAGNLVEALLPIQSPD